MSAEPEDSPPPIDIRLASWPADGEIVRTLFREYASGLGIDLAFQGFEEELAALPGKYDAVLLALRGGEALGCVALRPVPPPQHADLARLPGRPCEMKRLYVRPAARGCGLGLQLARRICALAVDAGYDSIVLDTLPSMAPALAVYATLGFERVAPYVYNPIEGALYLGRSLVNFKG